MNNNNNSQIDREKAEKRDEKIIAIIFSVLILVAGYFIGNYVYFDDETKSLAIEQQKLNELQVSNAMLENLGKNLPELESESDRLDVDYKKLAPLVPEKKDLTPILENIQLAATKRGLRLENFSPGSPKLKTGALSEIPIVAQVLGEDGAIEHYLLDLAHFNRVLQIDSVEYTRVIDGIYKGNVKVTINLSAFIANDIKQAKVSQ